MNIPKLREIQENIRLHPDHFDMKRWYSVTDEYGDLNELFISELKSFPTSDYLINNCGTAACIAGWTCLDLKDPPTLSVAWQARRILDLTYSQSERLFFTEDWPRKFTSGLDEDGELITTPELAIARIDHFIATEGRE